ncbi:gp53-like domain-containing protein [Escherichia coli]|uniref:gp53-like domain-containing protein n=2 Tax=Escherichia coli TaxID=562 RepID=UPI003D047A00
MHRIDTKTAQKDKFGAGKNGFTRGNPQTGTPATDLDDDYFDMLQEELCSVVEASGASLEKAQHDQLLTALRALLLSRKNPFGDIKSDGTVQTALENLGLGEAAKRNVGTEGNQIPSMSEWTSGAGWNRDPSGRIIQRGFAMTSSQTNILFPIPFPYDDFEVIVCAADSGANKGALNVLQKTRQGFSVSQVGSATVAYRWIAG